jgi:hypothetical protein
MRVIRTTDREENLCDNCPNRKKFPVCCPDDVEFGEGVGNDNIIACSECTSKYTETIYPGEISKLSNRKM